ncbi:conserved Plasmodium protein, unknown function [Plasmodium ovale wallikeri]|uniref:Uncharacterized protein n=1 Tax=Plasmodium ovale wallikeri TaxID=864142 RepID=A0A1A8ZEX4_PLAOA|nr:conserved Plasmodium protein, unknown function [Plasmodium ovale wallikeri]
MKMLLYNALRGELKTEEKDKTLDKNILNDNIKKYDRHKLRAILRKYIRHNNRLLNYHKFKEVINNFEPFKNVFILYSNSFLNKNKIFDYTFRYAKIIKILYLNKKGKRLLYGDNYIKENTLTRNKKSRNHEKKIGLLLDDNKYAYNGNCNEHNYEENERYEVINFSYNLKRSDFEKLDKIIENSRITLPSFSYFDIYLFSNNKKLKYEINKKNIKYIDISSVLYYLYISVIIAYIHLKDFHNARGKFFEYIYLKRKLKKINKLCSESEKRKLRITSLISSELKSKIYNYYDTLLYEKKSSSFVPKGGGQHGGKRGPPPPGVRAEERTKKRGIRKNGKEMDKHTSDDITSKLKEEFTMANDNSGKDPAKEMMKKRSTLHNNELCALSSRVIEVDSNELHKGENKYCSYLKGNSSYGDANDLTAKCSDGNVMKEDALQGKGGSTHFNGKREKQVCKHRKGTWEDKEYLTLDEYLIFLKIKHKEMSLERLIDVLKYSSLEDKIWSMKKLRYIMNDEYNEKKNIYKKDKILKNLIKIKDKKYYFYNYFFDVLIYFSYFKQINIIEGLLVMALIYSKLNYLNVSIYIYKNVYLYFYYIFENFQKKRKSFDINQEMNKLHSFNIKSKENNASYAKGRKKGKRMDTLKKKKKKKKGKLKENLDLESHMKKNKGKSVLIEGTERKGKSNLVKKNNEDEEQGNEESRTNSGRHSYHGDRCDKYSEYVTDAEIIDEKGSDSMGTDGVSDEISVHTLNHLLRKLRCNNNFYFINDWLQGNRWFSCHSYSFLNNPMISPHLGHTNDIVVKNAINSYIRFSYKYIFNGIKKHIFIYLNLINHIETKYIFYQNNYKLKNLIYYLYLGKIIKCYDSNIFTYEKNFYVLKRIIFFHNNINSYHVNRNCLDNDQGLKSFFFKVYHSLGRNESSLFLCSGENEREEREEQEEREEKVELAECEELEYQDFSLPMSNLHKRYDLGSAQSNEQGNIDINGDNFKQSTLRLCTNDTGKSFLEANKETERGSKNWNEGKTECIDVKDHRRKPLPPLDSHSLNYSIYDISNSSLNANENAGEYQLNECTKKHCKTTNGCNLNVQDGLHQFVKSDPITHYVQAKKNGFPAKEAGKIETNRSVHLIDVVPTERCADNISPIGMKQNLFTVWKNTHVEDDMQSARNEDLKNFFNFRNNELKILIYNFLYLYIFDEYIYMNTHKKDINEYYNFVNVLKKKQKLRYRVYNFIYPSNQDIGNEITCYKNYLKEKYLSKNKRKEKKMYSSIFGEKTTVQVNVKKDISDKYKIKGIKGSKDIQNMRSKGNGENCSRQGEKRSTVDTVNSCKVGITQDSAINNVVYSAEDDANGDCIIRRGDDFKRSREQKKASLPVGSILIHNKKNYNSKIINLLRDTYKKNFFNYHMKINIEKYEHIYFLFLITEMLSVILLPYINANHFFTYIKCYRGTSDSNFTQIDRFRLENRLILRDEDISLKREKCKRKHNSGRINIHVSRRKRLLKNTREEISASIYNILNVKKVKFFPFGERGVNDTDSEEARNRRIFFKKNTLRNIKNETAYIQKYSLFNEKRENWKDTICSETYSTDLKKRISTKYNQHVNDNVYYISLCNFSKVKKQIMKSQNNLSQETKNMIENVFLFNDYYQVDTHELNKRFHSKGKYFLIKKYENIIALAFFTRYNTYLIFSLYQRIALLNYLYSNYNSVISILRYVNHIHCKLLNQYAGKSYTKNSVTSTRFDELCPRKVSHVDVNSEQVEWKKCMHSETGGESITKNTQSNLFFYMKDEDIHYENYIVNTYSTNYIHDKNNAQEKKDFLAKRTFYEKLSEIKSFRFSLFFDIFFELKVNFNHLNCAHICVQNSLKYLFFFLKNAHKFNFVVDARLKRWRTGDKTAKVATNRPAAQAANQAATKIVTQDKHSSMMQGKVYWRRTFSGDMLSGPFGRTKSMETPYRRSLSTPCRNEYNAENSIIRRKIPPVDVQKGFNSAMEKRIHNYPTCLREKENTQNVYYENCCMGDDRNSWHYRDFFNIRQKHVKNTSNSKKEVKASSNEYILYNIRDMNKLRSGKLFYIVAISLIKQMNINYYFDNIKEINLIYEKDLINKKINVNNIVKNDYRELLHLSYKYIIKSIKVDHNNLLCYYHLCVIYLYSLKIQKCLYICKNFLLQNFYNAFAFPFFLLSVVVSSCRCIKDDHIFEKQGKGKRVSNNCELVHDEIVKNNRKGKTSDDSNPFDVFKKQYKCLIRQLKQNAPSFYKSIVDVSDVFDTHDRKRRIGVTEFCDIRNIINCTNEGKQVFSNSQERLLRKDRKSTQHEDNEQGEKIMDGHNSSGCGCGSGSSSTRDRVVFGGRSFQAESLNKECFFFLGKAINYFSNNFFFLYLYVYYVINFFVLYDILFFWEKPKKKKVRHFRKSPYKFVFFREMSERDVTKPDLAPSVDAHPFPSPCEMAFDSNGESFSASDCSSRNSKVGPNRRSMGNPEVLSFKMRENTGECTNLTKGKKLKNKILTNAIKEEIDKIVISLNILNGKKIFRSNDSNKTGDRVSKVRDVQTEKDNTLVNKKKKTEFIPTKNENPRFTYTSDSYDANLNDRYIESGKESNINRRTYIDISKVNLLPCSVPLLLILYKYIWTTIRKKKNSDLYIYFYLNNIMEHINLKKIKCELHEKRDSSTLMKNAHMDDCNCFFSYSKESKKLFRRDFFSTEKGKSDIATVGSMRNTHTVRSNGTIGTRKINLRSIYLEAITWIGIGEILIYLRVHVKVVAHLFNIIDTYVKFYLRLNNNCNYYNIDNSTFYYNLTHHFMCLKCLYLFYLYSKCKGKLKRKSAVWMKQNSLMRLNKFGYLRTSWGNKETLHSKENLYTKILFFEREYKLHNFRMKYRHQPKIFLNNNYIYFNDKFCESDFKLPFHDNRAKSSGIKFWPQRRGKKGEAVKVTKASDATNEADTANEMTKTGAGKAKAKANANANANASGKDATHDSTNNTKGEIEIEREREKKKKGIEENINEKSNGKNMNKLCADEEKLFNSFYLEDTTQNKQKKYRLLKNMKIYISLINKIYYNDRKVNILYARYYFLKKKYLKVICILSLLNEHYKKKDYLVKNKNKTHVQSINKQKKLSSLKRKKDTKEHPFYLNNQTDFIYEYLNIYMCYQSFLKLKDYKKSTHYKKILNIIFFKCPIIPFNLFPLLNL